jgi:hypothetical protein
MLKNSDFVKIRVFVPVQNAQDIRDAFARAGAGMQGNYSHCSGSYVVTGRFKPLEGSNPAIGSLGKLEEVQEEVVESLCHVDSVKKAIEEIKKVHPYEEPAIDIIPRLDIN